MSDRIKTMIVEDEPLAREGLLDYIQELDFLEVVAVCVNAMEAAEYMRTNTPDLVFLDIHMPKLSGIEFLKSLPGKTLHSQDLPMFILTTAYPSYALEGFELDVVDYLVKPYPFPRFLKAVNKAQSLHILKKSSTPRTKPSTTDHFFVQVEYKMERVNFDEITYIEGKENYMRIHCISRKLMTMTTLKNLEDTLPDHFLRVHKSYIVNRNHIQSIEAGGLRVQKELIPISRNRKQEILDIILKAR